MRRINSESPDDTRYFESQTPVLVFRTVFHVMDILSRTEDTFQTHRILCGKIKIDVGRCFHQLLIKSLDISRYSLRNTSVESMRVYE